jgi:hypothetical protein
MAEPEEKLKELLETKKIENKKEWIEYSGLLDEWSYHLKNLNSSLAYRFGNLFFYSLW